MVMLELTSQEHNLGGGACRTLAAVCIAQMWTNMQLDRRAAASLLPNDSTLSGPASVHAWAAAKVVSLRSFSVKMGGD